MKKFLLSICLIATTSLSAFAQTEYSGSYDIYGLGSDKSQVKKFTHSVEIGLGNEFQLGYRIHRNFNKYLTWDMFGFQWANDWGESFHYMDSGRRFDVSNEIGLTTGIRGKLPLNRSVKLFAALNLGYGQTFADEKYGDGYNTYHDDDTWPGFLTDLSLGISFSKFSLSYAFQHVTNEYSHTDHVVRLAFTF